MSALNEFKSRLIKIKVDAECIGFQDSLAFFSWVTGDSDN